MAKVIIVDDNGQRHVFPEGFDPKKAAGIVRTQLGAAETEKADALRPKSITDMNIGQVGEAVKQLGSMATSGMDAVNAGSARARDFFFGLPEAAKKFTETPPHETVANAARYAATEPARIGEQLGQGTPEALGQSVVDAAMYIPALMSGGRAVAGPAKSAAKSAGSAVATAVKSPVARGLGEAALYIPGVGPMIRGGIRGATRAMKKNAPAAETPLLSADADALRASTEVTAPAGAPMKFRGTAEGMDYYDDATGSTITVEAGSPVPTMPAAAAPLDRGRSAMPPAQQPAMIDVPKSARDRKLMAQEEASTALREASGMTPEQPLAHDSQAIKDISHPGAQAVMEREFQQNNPIFRQMQKDGTFGERGTLEAQLAERAEIAARESQTADLARGSRLTPKPPVAEPVIADDVLNSMEVVEPVAEVNTLGSRLGQVSQSQGRGVIDPEIEAIFEQMRPRSQPQPVSSVPSHVGGHQAEAVPGSPRTARSVYEPGGSQALTEEELIQLLFDIEQNRQP